MNLERTRRSLYSSTRKSSHRLKDKEPFTTNCWAKGQKWKGKMMHVLLTHTHTAIVTCCSIGLFLTHTADNILFLRARFLFHDEHCLRHGKRAVRLGTNRIPKTQLLQSSCSWLGEMFHRLLKGYDWVEDFCLATNIVPQVSTKCVRISNRFHLLAYHNLSGRIEMFIQRLWLHSHVV